jgi:hypothetical protein
VKVYVLSIGPSYEAGHAKSVHGTLAAAQARHEGWVEECFDWIGHRQWHLEAEDYWLLIDEVEFTP